MKKIVLLLSLLVISAATAQEFDAYLELRPRLELRNGYKNLLGHEQEGIELVNQRTRLSLEYQQERLYVKLSLQNARIWGDVPLLTQKDQNGIAVFEAYAGYQATQNLSVKLGRQVLAYDDQRIFAESDWGPQGLSHDALVFTLLPSHTQRLDVGLALNNGGDNLTDLPYRVLNYKNMQYLWYHIEGTNVGLSFLALNNGYEYELQPGVWDLKYRQTFGSYFNFRSQVWSGDAAFYVQTGEVADQDLNAWYGSASLSHQITSTWNTRIGAEYLSGSSFRSQKNRSFSPLFGNGHAFNGFMDYFYAGNHQSSVGLVDVYASMGFHKARWSGQVIPHYFVSAADLNPDPTTDYSRYLGTEVDLIVTYAVAPDIRISAGYSHMFGSESLEFLRGGDHDRTQNFAWLMVRVKPRLLHWKGNS